MGRAAVSWTLVLMLTAVVGMAAGGVARPAAGAAPAGVAPAEAPPAAVPADLDGDDVDDLVVGVPGEDLGRAVDAGVVVVLYGSGSGLAGGRVQQLSQAGPERGDRFGAAVATGDFDGDGVDDLAVGVPGEDVGRVVDAGAVQVFHGRAGGGLPAAGDQLLVQGAAGLAGTAEAGDRFGEALASGLLDDGDEADLAVGVPGEDVGPTADAGAVQVVEGDPATGLLGGANLQLVEASFEAGDRFGAAVEIGDLSGGGDPADHDDLAVGAPGEDVGAVRDAGAVTVVEAAGDGTGLSPAPVQQRFFQGVGEVPGSSEAGDRFGSALVAADLGSGGMDLAVGVPGEDVGRAADAGAVVLLVVPGLHQLLTQGSPTLLGAVPGGTEPGDRFGAALAAGDFDADAYDNLAVGTPGEDLDGVRDAGAVINLCGFDGEVFGCPDGVLRQANPEPGDAAGSSLAAGRYDSDAFADLAVGAPGERVGPAAAAGAVDVRSGSADGLPAGPAPLSFSGDGRVPGAAEAGDRFAASLAG